MRWSDTPRVEQLLLLASLTAFAVGQLHGDWDAFAPLSASDLGWLGLRTLLIESTSFGLWCCVAVLLWFQPTVSVYLSTLFVAFSLWDIFTPASQEALTLICAAIVVVAWAGALLVIVKRRNAMKRVVSRAVSHGAPLRQGLARNVLGHIDLFMVGWRGLVAIALVLLAGAVASVLYMSHVVEQRNEAQWKVATVTAVDEGDVTVTQDSGGTCTLTVLETYTVGDQVPTLISDTWCEITTSGEFVDPTWTVALFVGGLFLAAVGYQAWHHTPLSIANTVMHGAVTQCVGAVDGRRFPLPGVRWGRMPLMTISVPWNHAEVTAPRSPYLMPGGLDGGHHAVIQAVALTKACGWSHGLRIFLNELAADAKPSAATPHKETASIFLMDPKNPRRGVLLYRTGEIFWVNLVLAQHR